jgi:uncharacterized protein YidB (DUF937 family)
MARRNPLDTIAGAFAGRRRYWDDVAGARLMFALLLNVLRADLDRQLGWIKAESKRQVGYVELTITLIGVASLAGLGAVIIGAGGLLGGLGGLLDKLQKGGLGDVVNSWVGSGQNQPISPKQLSPALGPDIIKTLAQRSGLSEEELTKQLSQVLPGIVDKLTPAGRLPTMAELSEKM